MNNILVAKETKQIIQNRQYEVAGETINLPEMDFENVDIISPQYGEELLSANPEKKSGFKQYMYNFRRFFSVGKKV